jgi:chromosomal replication initiator protein
MSRVLDDLPGRFDRELFAALGSRRYAAWIAHTRPLGYDEECFTFHVPSSPLLDKLQEHLVEAVTEIARRVTNRRIRVRLEVEPASFGRPPEPESAPPAGGLAALVSGPGNRLALGAARAFVRGGPGDPRFLLVHARTGLGRTRLLQALRHDLAAAEGPGLLWFDGEAFRRYAVQAERQGRLDAFLARCRRATTFLLDDLHLLSGRNAAQHALADLLRVLRSRGARIAVTSEAPPRRLEDFSGLLKARLKADAEVSLDRPDPATSLAVLRRLAPRGVPDAVLAAVARHVGSGHRDQKTCLDRVLASGPLTGASVESAIAGFLSEWSFGLGYADIVKAAAELYGVRATDIYAEGRSRSASEARQACFYLARKLLKEPFARIGDHFGGRDHSTVHEACRKLKRARGSAKERIRRLEEKVAALKQGA